MASMANNMGLKLRKFAVFGLDVPGLGGGGSCFSETLPSLVFWVVSLALSG